MLKKLYNQSINQYFFVMIRKSKNLTRVETKIQDKNACYILSDLDLCLPKKSCLYRTKSAIKSFLIDDN